MYGPSKVHAAAKSALPGDSAHSCACAKHFICLIRPSGGRSAASESTPDRSWSLHLRRCRPAAIPVRQSCQSVAGT